MEFVADNHALARWVGRAGTTFCHSREGGEKRTTAKTKGQKVPF
jgi:hypothetical protein